MPCPLKSVFLSLLCCQILTFKEEEQWHIWRQTAAVLHLGNINFEGGKHLLLFSIVVMYLRELSHVEDMRILRLHCYG